MAFVNTVKTSHLDRLAYDEIRERRTPQGKYYIPVACGYIGLITQSLFNRIHGFPYSTGLHKYAAYAAIGVAFGFWADDFLLKNQQKKYARIKHYLMLHPEDFPPYPPPLKVGETLQTWCPRRPGW